METTKDPRSAVVPYLIAIIVIAAFLATSANSGLALPSTFIPTTTSSSSTVCSATPPTGEIEFHEASGLTLHDFRRLETILHRRVLRYVRCQGLLDDSNAAGMLIWQASGGFNVDASVPIDGEDRAGIERLVRYCARQPFAPERPPAVGKFDS